MKKLTLLFFAIITMVACKEEPKNYATFSGKITNPKSTKGFIQGKNYKKEITINEDGTFSDTLHLKDVGQLLSFSDGNEFTSIFLKNGDDVKITLDTKEFDESIKYTGKGSENNNYLAKKALLQEKLLGPDILNSDEATFTKKIKEAFSTFKKSLEEAKNLDPTLIDMEKKSFTEGEAFFTQYYKKQKKQREIENALIGKPSPTFNYENYKGGKTSLADLKGKYVYVDVWATWCGPCKAEIPFLKKLEEKYHGKNIAFVSISVDKAKSHDTWKKFVKEKNLGGIQLFADKDWNSDFVKAYGINGIPRFILIDSKGNVVNPNAPRPSNPKLVELFTSLGIK